MVMQKWAAVTGLPAHIRIQEIAVWPENRAQIFYIRPRTSLLRVHRFYLCKTEDSGDGTGKRRDE